jgi:hypothetical protein
VDGVQAQLEALPEVLDDALAPSPDFAGEAMTENCMV